MRTPIRYLLEQSDETLTTHSGLALVGLLLSKTKLQKRLDRLLLPDRGEPDISNFDVASSYLGLLCQGKSDFDHIEPFRRDDFFSQSLGIETVPSSPTLRQRLNIGGVTGWGKVVIEESVKLLGTLRAQVTPCLRKLVPLDLDVTPFDNSGTKKEGVSHTYKGMDGYSPIFAYLGEEGYGVNVELREGKEHSQNGTPLFLEKAIENARRVTDSNLLIRMDSGFDSLDNIKVCIKKQSDYIIKRNLRKESKEGWLMIAQRHGYWIEERTGKTVYRGDIFEKRGLKEPLRLVFEVIKRTIDAKGQFLLLPDLEVATYYTSLPDAPEVIIRQYQNHATSEQFHSEIKSELDLERLPSGKFETNNLVLHFGLAAYNILRFIGQESLKTVDSPLRKKAQRRRIRTVIQNLITLASRLVYHARRYKLSFGRYSPWFLTFRRIYISLNTT